LTNIVPFDFPGVLNELPGSLKTIAGGVRLPKLQVKRPVKLSQFSFVLGKIPLHHPIILAVGEEKSLAPGNPKCPQKRSLIKRLIQVFIVIDR
jgi:hypothetical protein